MKDLESKLVLPSLLLIHGCTGDGKSVFKPLGTKDYASLNRLPPVFRRSINCAQEEHILLTHTSLIYANNQRHGR
jgi:hypothetical protein